MFSAINIKEVDITETTSSFRLPHKKPLHQYYLHEILAGLKKIEHVMSISEAEVSNHHKLIAISKIAQSISELAMIHGFDGVEKIGHKLFSTLSVLRDSGGEFDETLREKVNLAVYVIRQVATMEAHIERQMNVERIDQTVERDQEKVQRCAEKFSESIEQLIHKQMKLPFKEKYDINKNENQKLLFDIREMDSILNIPKKITLQQDRNGTLELFLPDDLSPDE
ncbi:MAG: hypothetical protein ACE5HS_04600 [bacterium]